MELVAENESGKTRVGEPHKPDVAREVLGPQRFEFTGTGAEYFRIWVVNLLLTVLTLGIYSAWAKVRRLQYFYRNTRVAGATFDYHGKPGAILKGRILALILLGAYKFSFDISPVVGGAVLLILLVVMPWLLVRAFRFKLANSSYRGLRFHFRGRMRSAYLIVAFPVLALLLPGVLAGIFIPMTIASRAFGLMIVFLLLSALLMFSAYPMSHYLLKRYQHDNADYGQSPFTFHATKREFFKVYAKLLCFIVPAVIALFGGGIWMMKIYQLASSPLGKRLPFLYFLIAGYLLYFFVMAYLGSRIQNLVWRRTELVDHHFESMLGVRRLMWIQVSNILLIGITLGLYKPFASVRLLKYRVESMSLLPSGDLEEFLAAQFDEHVGALGQEAGDFFDIDIAL